MQDASRLAVICVSKPLSKLRLGSHIVTTLTTACNTHSVVKQAYLALVGWLTLDIPPNEGHHSAQGMVYP